MQDVETREHRVKWEYHSKISILWVLIYFEKRNHLVLTKKEVYVMSIQGCLTEYKRGLVAGPHEDWNLS